MKLYIPTCTLNFNNIFSTASISPKIFYTHRGFGNKRFYDVEPNGNEMAITLYSRCPFFNVDSDLENYPMIIEIESNDFQPDFFTPANKVDDVEVFISTQTIYLNPFHTKVFFYEYLALQNTVTKAQQSLENKFVNIFKRGFQVKTIQKKGFWGKVKEAFASSSDDYFVWETRYCPSYSAVSKSDCKRDVAIDRIMGFAYCYAIGSQSSVSPEIAQLKSLARRMRNTLSAIVNSPGRIPSASQDESITNDIRTFNSIYEKLDDVTRRNRQIIEARLRGQEELGLSSEQIIRCLKLNGVYDDFCKRLNLQRAYNAFELMSCIENYSPDRYDWALRNLQSAINHVEALTSSTKVKKPINELFCVTDQSINIQEDFPKRFYEELINSQIKGEYIALMSQYQIEDNEALGLAYNGGAILKRIMGANWDGSTTSDYVNNLLKHLQSNEPFNLHQENNEVLTSFAAFCQKGDNIDRLSEYLAQQGFANYKLAYGLYGATRGLASLPKTFTQSLVDKDWEYFSNVFITLYEQLFGVLLSDTSIPAESDTTVIVESKIGATIIQNLNQVEPKTKKQEQVVRAISETAKLETAVQNPRAFMYILDSFPQFKRTNAYKRLIEAHFEEDLGSYDSMSFRQKIYTIIGPKDLKSQKDKIDRAIELESLRDNPEAFLKILDNFLSPSDKAYKEIQKLLELSFGSSTSTETEAQSPKSERVPTAYQRSIFEDNDNSSNHISQHHNSIIDDDYAVEKLRMIPEIANIAATICSMFTYFQQNYRGDGYYAQRPEQYRRNNSDVIDHFCKWCLSDKNKKHLSRTHENSKMMDAVKSKLMSFYPD